MNDITAIPFANGWELIGGDVPDDDNTNGGIYRYGVSDGATKIIVEFAMVNTMTTRPTAEVRVWFPGQNEPHRERGVPLGDSRAMRALVQAWESITDSAAKDLPLLKILWRLSRLVLDDSELTGESLNLSTAEVTDETREVMLEPNIIDQQLTSWFSQAGEGKSKLLTAVAADISQETGESFLGFNYAQRRPFLYLDWEETGVYGRNVFLTQLDAVCRGHGIDRADTRVHYLQPNATFARALPEIIAERDRLTELYDGIVPVTGIDSVTKAMGGNALSLDGWAEFDNAWRHYSTTTIALDHEVKSDAGRGRLQGLSPKTASFRHTVYLEQKDGLLILRSRKSNRTEERAIATFHVRVTRDEEDRVVEVEYRPGLSARQGSGAEKRPTITAKPMILMWARLTGESVTGHSFDGDAAFSVFTKDIGSSLRNQWKPMVKKGLLVPFGKSTPQSYQLTDDGRIEADRLLAENPEVQERYDELHGSTE